ncbi:11554_t:CDS:2, partial [Funneliformis caledonium]
QSSHKIRENAFYVRFISSLFTSSANHIEIQHANFYKELNKRGIDVKIKNVFKRYTNVISIETDERNVKIITEIEHVESVEPVKLYKRNKFNKKNLKNKAEDFRYETVLIAPDNDINAIHEITGVKKFREILKLLGHTWCQGVTPDIIFGAYKVLPLDCPSDYDVNNKVYNIHRQEFLDMVMKAIIMAVDDGMDIINLSIGSEGDNRGPLSIMINDLAKYKGIIFISTAGNDGILSVFTSLMPSDIQNTISVSSFRTDKVINFKAFDPKNPEFVINYITRSTLVFPFQSANVKLFLMNKCSNDYKEFINTLIIIDFRENLSCIDIMISPLGRFLIFPEIIEEGLPNVSYGYMEYKPYSVVPSVFSSWGLSVELDIKPEISAPGQHIFQLSYRHSRYIEVFGKLQSYEQLKVAFMNNAVPYKDRNNLLAPVVIQGAGFINAFKLLKAISFVYPPKINLNDT